MYKILIVEDNKQNRSLLERLLNAHSGWEAISAANGAEALEIIHVTPPDMIISDIMMPIMDGFELCKRCKSDEILKNIPFIFYTATYTDQESETLALYTGADRFIIKPQPFDVFTATILEVIDEYHEKNYVSHSRPLGDEMEVLRQYNEVLFAKLEKKVFELEALNEKLKIELEEHKRIELLLQESEERYKSIFKNAHVVMLYIDLVTGDIIDANDAACSFYGYTKEEMISKKIADINILSEKEVYAAMRRSHLKEKNHFVFCHRLSYGEIRNVEVYSSPITIKGKLFLFSVIHDITNPFFNPFFDNMLNGVAYCKMLYDEYDNPIDFIYLDINKALEKITHTRRGGVIGKRATDLFPDIKSLHPELFDIYGNVAVTENSENLEVYFKPLKIWLRINVYSPLKGYFIAIVDDITERKQMEEELRDVNLNLQKRVQNEIEKNRVKDQIMFEQSRHIVIGELLVNISHHWRQPLCAIGLIIQDIRDAYLHNELDVEYMDKSVDAMMSELNALSDTIENFRNFYVQDNEKRDFNVTAEIDKALMLLAGYIKDKGIVIDKALDDSLLIQGFPNEFAQVILNILTNAKDVFEKRNIINGVININSYKDSTTGKMIISIKDNGGGIQEDIMDKIFDPYFTTKHKTRGTGIGLYMAKVLIEKSMNGTLSVRNISGGCEFRIEI